MNNRLNPKFDRKRIAIIGSGISGLTSAYRLHQDFNVTVFESNDYLGGHTDTHALNIDGQVQRIDSGFIIFCPGYYPNFYSMLRDLGVEYQPTNMSFSAFNPNSGVIYNATNPNRLFCDRKNLIRPTFWKMVFDIIRFYRQAPKILSHPADLNESVADYLLQNGYGESFQQDHLLPMISALWSATPDRVKEFPIYHLVEFFERHGLMKIIGRPQWYVIKNGSASYVEALQAKLNCEWRLNEAVTSVERTPAGVTVHSSIHKNQKFDAVIFATHADTTLKILDTPSATEQQVLSAIPFEQNHVVVHCDESVMHPNKLSWASWNTAVPTEDNTNSLNCCTANYWMNLLQGLDTPVNVFTSLNPCSEIDESKILTERKYAHPVYTAESVAAQKRLSEINGVNRTFHAGAFWGWGFHEDGARSAVNACQMVFDHFANELTQEVAA